MSGSSGSNLTEEICGCHPNQVHRCHATLRKDRVRARRGLNRLIENALNLADLVNRAMGGDIAFRDSPPNKRVQIRIGEPIIVRELCPLIPGKGRERAQSIMKVVISGLESLSREE